MSGRTPQRSTAPPRAVQMPVLTSSKMSTMPCFLVSARTPSRKPGSGSTTPRFIIAGSMMRAAGGLPSLDHALDALGHVLDVVERHRDGQVDRALRDAAAVGERRVVVARADLAVVERADADHDVVVMAVVRAEHLDDGLAAGEGAGDADGVHGGLGARVDEAPLRELEGAGEVLGHDDGVLGRQAELRAERRALLDGLDDERVGVALDHAAVAVVEVDDLLALDAPDVRALAVGEVDRVRVTRVVRGGDAHRHVLDGALVELVRLRRLVLEPLLFLLHEFRDELAVRYALCHVGCSPSQLCRLGLRSGRRYRMLTAPPRGSAGRRGMWLGQSVGVVTLVCVSPRNACLVPPETWEPCSRARCGPGWSAGASGRLARDSLSGFRRRSVGFGNELAVSEAESATLGPVATCRGRRPSGRTNGRRHRRHVRPGNDEGRPPRGGRPSRHQSRARGLESDGLS